MNEVQKFGAKLLFCAFGLSVCCTAIGYLPQFAHAEEAVATFIDSPLWFSEEPSEGKSVVISAAILNSANSTLSGTVSFYDKETVLGKMTVSIPARGVRVASVTWKVTVGDHRIHAELSQGKVGEGTKAVPLASVSTEEIKKNITHVIAIAPPRDDRGDTPEGKQLAVVDALQEKIVSFLPEPVIAAAEQVDSLRAQGALKSEALRDEAKESLRESKTVPEGKSTTITKETPTDTKPLTPFTYVKLFFGYLGAFILGNAIVSYGLLVILLYLAFRAIINKITD
jgi:hypothetical protein